MAVRDIAASLRRAKTVLHRRPATALHDDAPATTRWDGGLRFVATHANGTQVRSDMPSELGGGGDAITPGWLFRAGFASCTATAIAMTAFAEGIELEALELVATSRSDTRGVLGMADASGEPISPGARDVQLLVRIAAKGVAPERLRALVEKGYCCSPAATGLAETTPVTLRIEVGDG